MKNKISSTIMKLKNALITTSLICQKRWEAFRNNLVIFLKKGHQHYDRFSIKFDLEFRAVCYNLTDQYFSKRRGRQEKSKFVCQFPLSILVIQHHYSCGGTPANPASSAVASLDPKNITVSHEWGHIYFGKLSCTFILIIVCIVYCMYNVLQLY